MYNLILVSTDGSETATRAVGQAAELAKHLGARLAIATITEPSPSFNEAEIGWSVPGDVYAQISRANLAKGEAILRAAIARAKQHGMAADSFQTEARRPYEGILGLAEQTGADLIVMGSKGRKGVDRLLLGSQAAAVLSGAQVPVLIVK